MKKMNGWVLICICIATIIAAVAVIYALGTYF